MQQIIENFRQVVEHQDMNVVESKGGGEVTTEDFPWYYRKTSTNAEMENILETTWRSQGYCVTVFVGSQDRCELSMLGTSQIWLVHGEGSMQQVVKL